MAVDVRPLTEVIGVEVIGLDMADTVDQETIKRLRRAWVEATVMVIRDQKELTPEQQVEFGRRLGTVTHHTFSQYCLPGYPEIAVVSNVSRNGKPLGAHKGGLHWHTDSQYLHRPPSGSLLVAKELPPEGGDTLFANMAAAYNALPEHRKQQAERLKVIHSRVKTWPVQHPERPPLSPDQAAKMPDICHPLVRVHPETGRRSLFLGAIMWGIDGWPLEKGRAFLAELVDLATQPRFVYRHRWRRGDAVLWDNRSTLHSATPLEDNSHPRVMYRIQLEGEAPLAA